MTGAGDAGPGVAAEGIVCAWIRSDACAVGLKMMLDRGSVQPLMDAVAAELAAAQDRVAAARDDALEEAAALLAPAGPRPCDCEHCDCGNPGDHAHVVAWDEANSNSAAIRALKTRTPGVSHGD